MQHLFSLTHCVMCNLLTWDGNLKFLNHEENKKYRAVNLAEVQNWWALGLEKGFFYFRRTNLLPPWGQDLVGTGCSMGTLGVGAGDTADRWLQFSSLLCTQKAGQKTHRVLHGFCGVFWTRHAVLRLQPKSKVRFVRGISNISYVTVILQACAC